jgi:hypothetical protein
MPALLAWLNASVAAWKVNSLKLKVPKVVPYSVIFVFCIAQYNKSTPLTSRSRSDVLNTKAKDPDPYRTYLAVSDMDPYLWLTDPAPDPAVFIHDLHDANKRFFDH